MIRLDGEPPRSWMQSTGLPGTRPSSNLASSASPLALTFAGPPLIHVRRDIPYAFTLDPGTRTTILTEDSLGQNPSVEYIIVWPAVNPAGDPFAGKQPCVSWGVNNPQFPATPDQYGCGGDYVPGLACLTDDLDIGGGAMPPIPPIAPFTGNSHPQYLPGQNAKVCIAQHGFSSGTGAATGSIIYWTKVIDQSDTGIRLP